MILLNQMEDNKKGSNLRWWILLTVIVGTFLGRLDQTIVNLALPKIINDFGITVSAAGGWVDIAFANSLDVLTRASLRPCPAIAPLPLI